MGITLDKNLFYRVRCGGGNPSSDLIRFEGNTHRSDLGDGRQPLAGSGFENERPTTVVAPTSLEAK